MIDYNNKRLLHIYNVLNTVKPINFQTKFPYSIINPNKITLTKKKITIMVNKFENKNSNTTDSKINNIKGGGYNNIINFYG